MQHENLIVTGMTCSGCVNSLTQALKSVTGVSEVNVLLASGKTTVKYDENLTSPLQLRLVVENAGFGISSESAG